MKILFRNAHFAASWFLIKGLIICSLLLLCMSVPIAAHVTDVHWNADGKQNITDNSLQGLVNYHGRGTDFDEVIGQWDSPPSLFRHL